MRAPSRLWIYGLVIASLGCGRSRPPASASANATTPTSDITEAEPIHDTIQEFRRGERVACAAGTDLVYVVSRDGELHSFDPVALRFQRIGELRCPGTRRSLPHSMAVDRGGQAWVGYDNGVIALANITTAECTASRVNVRSARIGARFGMGFAPTPEGGIGGETLFLTTEPPLRLFTDGHVARGDSLLARIDDGETIRVTGRFPPSFHGLSGELSSRSDGRLFAFFTGVPFQLAEVDPENADIRWQKDLNGMRFAESGSGSWAFAAVGSEFFFFWADQASSSVVTRLKEDGTLEHVIPNAGIQIVGAGASTCVTGTKRAVTPPMTAPAPAPPPPAASSSTPLTVPPSESTGPKATPGKRLPPLPPPTWRTFPPSKRPRGKRRPPVSR